MERKRILIAVNNPPEIQELRKALFSAGYQVKVVENGSAALELCRQYRPHLVFAELQLAKVDGHHLLREVKSQPATKHISFVLMCKHRSVDERVHTINLGVDDYVTFPFDIEEVLVRFEILFKEIETFEALPKRHARGFSGKLADMNLVELAQALEIGQKSGVIRLHNNNDDGLVFLRKGQIVDAALQDLSPKEALCRMFTWSEGTFRFEIKEIEQPSEFEESTSELVDFGLKYRDHWLRLSGSLPPLNSVVKAVADAQISMLSAEEKSLLNLLNGSTRLTDVIEKSQFDDIATLKLIARLFSNGAITEISNEDTSENGKRAGQQNGKTPDSGARISDLVGDFVDNDTSRGGRVKRRKLHRHQEIERRIKAGGWSGLGPEQNQVHLNKSELLMIRAKLGNGQKS